MFSKNQLAFDMKEAALKVRETMLEVQESAIRDQMMAFDLFEAKLEAQWQQLDSLVSESEALMIKRTGRNVVELAEPATQYVALDDKEAIKSREMMLEVRELMFEARKIELDLLMTELRARRQRLESAILKLRAIKAKIEGIEQALENDEGEIKIEQTSEDDESEMTAIFKSVLQKREDESCVREVNVLVDRMIWEARVQLNPELSIDRLCISARPRHHLEWNGIYTIDQREALSRSDLLNIRGLGPKGVNEIADKLKALTEFELPD